MNTDALCDRDKAENRVPRLRIAAWREMQVDVLKIKVDLETERLVAHKCHCGEEQRAWAQMFPQ